MKNKILKLIQDINSYGVSFPMNYIKISFCEKMDLEKERTPIFKETIKKINSSIDKINRNIEDYASIVELKNSYSEAYIYSKLNAFINISKVKEQDTKTPDYKVHFQDSDIYIEMKSLNMFEGVYKQKTIMQSAFNNKVKIESEIKNGANFASSVQEIAPYKSNTEDSIKTVIESLIDKINQNVKSGQYEHDTVLLIDFSNQLTLLSPTKLAVLEHYHDTETNSDVSGELWHVAFGEYGKQLKNIVKFEGDDRNKHQVLEKDGILTEHSFIKGLVFHINENFYYFSFINSENIKIVNLFEYLSSCTSSRYIRI